MKKFMEFINADRGPATTEYAVMLALLCIVCITAIAALGLKISQIVSEIEENI